MSNLNLEVNGQAVQLQVEPQRLLVEVLREQLGLTGTHVGCDTSQCGACTVLLDGQPVKSCTMLAVQAEGRRVTTVEGLAAGRRAAPDAAGLHRLPRPAMRLLHAGHDHVRRRAAASTRRTRARRRSSTRSKATCAAAPATSTSSPRSSRPPRRWLQEPRNERRRTNVSAAASRCAASRTRRWSPARASSPTTSRPPARPS